MEEQSTRDCAALHWGYELAPSLMVRSAAKPRVSHQEPAAVRASILQGEEFSLPEQWQSLCIT
jgi:hypothetical protein